jgi:hypothetical protein
MFVEFAFIFASVNIYLYLSVILSKREVVPSSTDLLQRLGLFHHAIFAS